MSESASSKSELSTQVRVAHGDAWQEQGRLREPFGGGRLELPGIRLMASGLNHPQWNNGDVSDPGLVDLALVADWYAERQVPWGVRVPTGMPWSAGVHLFHKRLMGLVPAGFVRPPPVRGLDIRVASSADLDAVLTVDCEAFESNPDVERPWIEPHIGFPNVTVALACLDGEPVGTAYSLESDGLAGPALYLAGVAVSTAARGRGVAASISSWLLEQGFAAGARMAHLHPDTDPAARVYARLGFEEVDGFEVFVDVA